jgi:transposase
MNIYNYFEEVVNNLTQTIKEKKRKQSFYDRRFQAPFCCGHRMKDNRNDGTEFWCPHCGKLEKAGERK